MSFKERLRKIFINERAALVVLFGSAWIGIAWMGSKTSAEVKETLRKHTENEIRAKMKPDTVRIHDTVKCTVFVAPRKTGPKPITQGEIDRWD